jgi:hypothetical protein
VLDGLEVDIELEDKVDCRVLTELADEGGDGSLILALRAMAELHRRPRSCGRVSVGDPDV